MGDYHSNYRGGGSRGGGGRYGGRDSGRGFGGGRDFGRPQMHHAKCADCGKDCEVPFRPTGDRPVYCSDCFEKRGNSDGGGRGSDNRSFQRPNFAERRTYPPSGGDGGKPRVNDNGQMVDQLKSLNMKLDKIINLLEHKSNTSLSIQKEITDLVLKPKADKSIITKEESEELQLKPKGFKPPLARKKARKVKTPEPLSS